MSILNHRFWKKVRDRHGCWVWTGAVGNSGYGQWAVNGTAKSVHRLTWIELRGDIPDGLHVDHLCQNKRCVNPWHMDLVTQAVNTRRRYEHKDSCLLPNAAPWNHVESLHEKQQREREAEQAALLRAVFEKFIGPASLMAA